jgi:proteasome accessory factor PafA2
LAIPKVMGIETEYGISAPGIPEFNPVMSSSLLIGTYAGSLRRIRWDYEQESPMRDARGFEPAKVRDPSDEDLGLANVLLPNGARYYVDHAHPEYSSPECATPRSLVVHDKAGERILEASVLEVDDLMPPGHRLAIYKNNSDGKGNSYGCHENYLMSRDVPFGDIVRDLTSFFVTRQIMVGAGKVGSEGNWQKSDPHAFQLSQRADFFEAEVGLETTLKRPIINTRDEPHADPAVYRRLHVIVGDANMSEISTYLKVGTTALVLNMIEDAFLPDLSLASPVHAIHDVSRDLTCRAPLEMADGRWLSPLAIQWEYLERAKKWVEQESDEPWAEDVIQRWETVLQGLEDDPMSLHDQLDWVAKYRLMLSYMDRDRLDWSSPKLRAIDLQYHDVRRNRGLYYRLESGGRIRRLIDEAEVEAAVALPPEDTRAWFRGRCIGLFPDAIAAASWDSLILDTGADALQRVPMKEPLKGTKKHVEALLQQASSPAELIALLGS